MSLKFDIFKRLPDGQPLWVKAVKNLKEAKDQLTVLEVAEPGEYFIYDSQNGNMVQPTEFMRT